MGMVASMHLSGNVPFYDAAYLTDFAFRLLQLVSTSCRLVIHTSGCSVRNIKLAGDLIRSYPSSHCIAESIFKVPCFSLTVLCMLSNCRYNYQGSEQQPANYQGSEQQPAHYQGSEQQPAKLFEELLQ